MVVDTQRRNRFSKAFLVLALAAAASVAFVVTLASADAPMTTGTISVTVDPVTTMSGTQVRKVTVHGTWAFSTHGGDCNADIAGAGYAVAWDDPDQPGNLVTTVNGNQILVGTASGNAFNQADDEVHPTPADAPGTLFSDPLYTNVPPKASDIAKNNWKSGCGTYDPVADYNSGTWGPLSHYYAVTDLEQGVSICVVLYNVAASGSNTANSFGGSVPVDQVEVTAGGPAAKPHNDNNSVEAMGIDNVCTSIALPGLTNAASGPVTVGSSTPITDTATMHNASGAPPASTVTFNVYAASDTNCASPLNNRPLAATGSYPTYTSAPYTPATPGSYVWVASFTPAAGDSHNIAFQGICNDSSAISNPISVVTKTAPSLGLQVTPAGPVAIGTSASAKGALTGATANAGGTITYALYSDSACTTSVADLTPASNTVSGTTVPASKSRTFTSAGTDYFQAAYSGDALNGAATSACAAGQLVVNQNTPTLGTQLSTTGPVAIGTAVTEQAALSGATSDAGGTITYGVYSDSACTVPVADLTPSPNAVSAGAVPRSASYTFTAAGTYYLGASYSGDANNAGPVAAPCTSGKILVTQNTPSVAAQLSLPGPAAIGGAETVQATLSGATANAGGTIAYGVYADSTCTTLATDLTPASSAVAAGAAPASTAYALTHAGTYYLRATYSGDANNAGPVSSACAAGRLVVSPNTPTLAIALSQPGPVAIGTSDSAQATIQGATAAAGGSITYTLYADGTCTSAIGDLTPAANRVTAGAAPASKSITLTSAGTYSFRATYSGDADNTGPVSSPCASGRLVVSPNAPSIGLQLSRPGPVAIGTSVSAQASLTGATADAGGTVTYALYSDGACTIPVANLTPALPAVTAGAAPASLARTFTKAGSFWFQATYSGDPNNTGPVTTACASGRIDVSPDTPSVTAQLSVTGHVGIGTPLSAQATLTGATGDAGGTITYTLYSDAACTTAVTAMTPSPNTVAAGAAPASTTTTLDAAGTYYLRATYSGDPNNTGPVTSACASGQVVVDPNVPSLTTQVSVSGPVAIGTSVSGQGTLHGATASAGGSIAYGLYANDTCTVLVTDLTPAASAVSGASIAASNPVLLSAAGTYYLQATYSGDPNNTGPVSSACASGRVVVNQNTPALTLALSQPGPVAIGTAVSAQATLQGATGDAGGTVTYRVYGDSSCTSAVANLTPAANAVAGGSAPASLADSPAAAGTYWFQATYSGDGNNAGPVSSPCAAGQLVVSPNTPTLTAQLSGGGPVAIGTSISEQATLHGATADAGGTVTYGLYANDTCTTAVADLTPSADAVTAGAAPASAAYPFPSAGTFYFQATYSGDGNNTGPVTTACASGKIVVTRLSPPLTLQLSAASPVAIGTSVTAQATLNGATANAGGTISYALYSDADCANAIVDDLTPAASTVTAGTVPPSKAHVFGNSGTFYFRAAYSGDSNNNPASTACTSGAISVSPNAPTLTVQLSTAGAVPIGTSVTAQAALQGATAAAAGSATYSLYADASCTVLVADLTPSPSTVAGGGVPESRPFVLASAGTFYLRASYSGDPDNGAAASSCASGEVDVTPNTPTLTAQLSRAGPVAIGTSVSAQGALHGATSDASGTVSYKLYSDSACTALVAVLTPAANAVSAGTVPSSLAYTFTSAGAYFFQATYSGDANNTGPVSSSCSSAQLAVSQNTPTLTTQLTAGSPVAAGTGVGEQATLHGATTTPGGTVTYAVYADSGCTTRVEDLTPPINSVTAALLPASKLHLFSASGTFWFQAAYSGDANDAAASSPCAAGQLTVASPKIAVTVGPATQVVAAGADVTFSVTVANTGSATLTNVATSASAGTDCARTAAQMAAIAPHSSSTFAPGDSVAYSCTEAAVAAAGTVTVTATGTPAVGAAVSDTGSAAVTLATSSGGGGGGHGGGGGLLASVAISIGPQSQSIATGGTATFQITVTNNGQYTLQNVNVSDPVAPGCNRGPATLQALGVMDPGATATYSCTLGNVGSSMTNTATVDALAANSQSLEVSDSAQVTVSAALSPPPAPAVKTTTTGSGSSGSGGSSSRKAVTHHPRLALTMSPKMQTRKLLPLKPRSTTAAVKRVLKRPTATFTITVKNTGDVTLSSVRVSDAHARACAKRLGTLVPGKSVTYRCRRAKLSRSFKNAARVTGLTPGKKPTVVTASALATVVVKRPRPTG